MKRQGLLQQIQQRTIELINGYLVLPENDMSSLITTSNAGNDAGLVGAIVLAQRALQDDDDEEETERFNSSKQPLVTGCGMVCW